MTKDMEGLKENGVDVKRLTRYVGTDVYTGTMVKQYGSYVYDYPQNREINEQLMVGDRKRIANRLGVTEQYVSDVLAGKRFNAGVISEAKQLVEFNERNGYLTKKSKEA